MCAAAELNGAWVKYDLRVQFDELGVLHRRVKIRCFSPGNSCSAKKLTPLDWM